MKKSQKHKTTVVLDKVTDYGYDTHVNYLNELFGVMPAPSLRSDYVMLARNFGNPNRDSIQHACLYLYTYYALEINKKLDDTSPENSFIFLCKLINGITTLQWNAPVPEAEINSIKYSELFSVLSSFELRAIIGTNKSPSIKIINTRANNLIFQIRLKKETLDITGFRFDVLFETGKVLESVLQSTESV